MLFATKVATKSLKVNQFIPKRFQKSREVLRPDRLPLVAQNLSSLPLSALSALNDLGFTPKTELHQGG